MKSFLFLSLALFAMSANAQTKAGGISPEMLQKIEQSQKNCKTQRALRNAIASNNINNLAKNPQKQGPVDNHFSVETTSQSIHDQKSSGRCWMFTSMNVLRSDFARQHKDTLAVEFSHDYTFFFDQLEKSNLFLQGAINTAAKDIEDPEVKFFFKAPINDGGTFCGIIDLTAKYGLVPKCVMPETYQSENSRLQGQIISTKLREFGLELRKMVQAKKKPAAIEARKTEMLAEVYRILSMTLGEPVKEFKYAHRDKTGKIIGEGDHHQHQQQEVKRERGRFSAFPVESTGSEGSGTPCPHTHGENRGDFPDSRVGKKSSCGAGSGGISTFESPYD